MSRPSDLSVMTGDLQASFVRTLVPLIVGYVVSIAARHGFNINDDQAASLLTAGGAYVYYVAVRYLETHAHSKFGWLLGVAQTPTYVNPPAVVEDSTGTRVVDTPDDNPTTSGTDVPVDPADGGSEPLAQPRRLPNA